jgi:enoyl-[acyl-carrier-protein] reductase (NADH)
MIPSVKAKLLEGKKGLVVGIANENSIAWGCAKAFRAFGAELAVTYLNDKARKYVEPLARELEAPIVMPLDVRAEGQMEAVFERIAKDWGKLDFVVHSIAFSPKEALQGRVVDVSREGFLTTMDVSCWTFIRMAHLAEPLMRKGGTLFTMTYYGSQMVVKNYNIMGVAKGARGRGALYRRRARPEGHPRPRHLARAAGDSGRLGDSGIRRAARQGESQGTRAQPRQHRGRRRRHRLSRARCGPPHHRRDALHRRRLPHHRLVRDDPSGDSKGGSGRTRSIFTEWMTSWR